jgi:lysozyme family protein
LTAPDLVRKDGEFLDSALFSKGKISADAKPGSYPISFTCVDRKVTGEFTIVAADAKPAAVKAQVPVKPKGAVDAGSLEQPAADNDALLIGAGAAALLAAGGAGVWAHRRRQRV